MKPVTAPALTLQGRVQATVADLLGQALAIQNAAVGPEVARPARDAALARADGIRDAAAQMQKTLRGETTS